MTQDRVFSLIGDSNVRRFLTSVNRRACPDINDTQIQSCGKLSMLAEGIRQVRPESNVILITCVTNFITDSVGSASVGVRVEPVIARFKAIIESECVSSPERKFLIGPPMFRSNPVWYHEGLAEVLQKFSSVMSSQKPPNLFLLPSFPTPEFESDGVHLTPYAGLEYLIHLFDASKDLLSASEASDPVRIDRGSESTRLLEDRMMVVEQKQLLMSKTLELKTAVDAELACFQENVRNEVFFLISGLKRIPAGLRGKDWQTQAQRDVSAVIVALLGKELPIVVVQNVTGRGSDAEVRYHVKMEFAAHSHEIRSKFGSFFAGKVDKRPPTFASISISNRVTPATQVRLAIMKLQARKYLASNPKATARVIGYEARPMLRIVPPSGSSDSRIKNFTFIDAVKKLPATFTDEELKPVLKKAGGRFAGQMRALFVVLNDDMRSGGVASKASEAEAEVDPEVVDHPESLEFVQAPPASKGAASRKRGPDSVVGTSAKRS